MIGGIKNMLGGAARGVAETASAAFGPERMDAAREGIRRKAVGSQADRVRDSLSDAGEFRSEATALTGEVNSLMRDFHAAQASGDFMQAENLRLEMHERESELNSTLARAATAERRHEAELRVYEAKLLSHEAMARKNRERVERRSAPTRHKEMILKIRLEREQAVLEKALRKAEVVGTRIDAAGRDLERTIKRIEARNRLIPATLLKFHPEIMAKQKRLDGLTKRQRKLIEPHERAVAEAKNELGQTELKLAKYADWKNRFSSFVNMPGTHDIFNYKIELPKGYAARPPVDLKQSAMTREWPMKTLEHPLGEMIADWQDYLEERKRQGVVTTAAIDLDKFARVFAQNGDKKVGADEFAVYLRNYYAAQAQERGSGVLTADVEMAIVDFENRYLKDANYKPVKTPVTP